MARAAAKYDVRINEEIIYSEPFMGGEHTKTIRRWTITITGTSYNCVITECPCGLRQQTGLKYKPRPADEPREDWNKHPEIEQVFSVELTNCTCKSEAHRGSRAAERDRVCHGWHRARIDKTFAEVARPPKPALPKLPARSGPATPMSTYEREHRAMLKAKYADQPTP